MQTNIQSMKNKAVKQRKTWQEMKQNKQKHKRHNKHEAWQAIPA